MTLPSGPAEPQRPDPSSTHRGRRKASSVVLPVVFALALVLVGFLGVWAWLGLFQDEGDVTVLDSPSATPTSGSNPPSPTTSEPTSPSPSASPTKTKSSPNASPTPSRTQDRSVPVVVFNQTGVSGLAANFAARLQQAGWAVGGVGNWVGTVPSTTVYYRAGDEAAARTLTRDFPEVGRIRPAVTGMPERGLTVILAGSASYG